MKIRNIWLFLLLLVCSNTGAQMVGDNLIQVGIAHLAPQEKSQPLRTQLRPSQLGAAFGIDNDFSSSGTSTSVESTETLALRYSRFFTDHIALTFVGGIPPTFKLSGRGVVAPTGFAGMLFNVDLGDPENNPLTKVKQRSPGLLLHYYFSDRSAAFRPFLGVGATYTWFTNVNLNDAFEDDLNQSFGRVLAFAANKPGPTTVRAHASSSWSPIVDLGFFYTLNGGWGISASLSYSTLETDPRIDISAADGTSLATSTSHVDINPLVASFLVNYAF